MPVEPTCSVVELPKPHDQAAPDPEQVANKQHVPDSVELEFVLKWTKKFIYKKWLTLHICNLKLAA